jgi:hypothetical protein
LRNIVAQDVAVPAYGDDGEGQRVARVMKTKTMGCPTEARGSYQL